METTTILWTEHMRHALAELQQRPLLHRLLGFAERRGVELYTVGGTLRDICLGRAVHDVDLTMVGDVIGFANAPERNPRFVIFSALRSGIEQFPAHIGQNGAWEYTIGADAVFDSFPAGKFRVQKGGAMSRSNTMSHATCVNAGLPNQRIAKANGASSAAAAALNIR